MNLKDTYKKQGGKKLLRQYWKSGAFWTAVAQFFILGKTRTALEILRLSATFKTKNKLAKKYKKTLESFDKSFSENDNNQRPCNKVWFCWLQGIDNAPSLVKQCYESLTCNLDREIVVLTKDNFSEYVTFPDYILKKYKKGIITETHFSDLLRLALLTEYGGTWIDATVFCTRKERDIPKFFFNSDLFMYQNLKPGRDGHSTYISSWFITAKPNNKILCATKELLYKYWERENYLIDYFLLHIFMSICIDYYDKEWSKVVPIDNSLPHILMLSNNTTDDVIENTINSTPFHKINRKTITPQLEQLLQKISEKNNA